MNRIKFINQFIGMSFLIVVINLSYGCHKSDTGKPVNLSEAIVGEWVATEEFGWPHGEEWYRLDTPGNLLIWTFTENSAFKMDYENAPHANEAGTYIVNDTTNNIEFNESRTLNHVELHIREYGIDEFLLELPTDEGLLLRRFVREN